MRKRFLLSVLLLFALVLAPSLSLADDGFGGSVGGSFDGDYGVKYTTVTHDGGWTGFLVKAADSWSAAVYACGGDPARISADVRSKLSDPNYGGAFYMYATNYAHIMSVYEIPDFVPVYVLAGLGISSVWHGEFGDMMLWYADTPNSLLESAMVDFQRVLAGEDLGGGSGENISDYLDVEINCSNIAANNSSVTIKYFTCKRASIDSSGNVTLGSGTVNYSAFLASPYYISSAHLYVSPAWQTFASQYVSQGKKVIVGASPHTSTSPAALVIIVCDSYTVSRHQNPNSIGSTKDFLVLVNGSRYVSRGNAMYADGIGPFFVVPSSSNPVLTSVNGETDLDYWAEFSPVLPPAGEWPESETPVTPDPPEIPSPTAPTTTTDPTIVEPTVTWPDITISVQPTPDTTDYTELLKAINNNLNSLRSDLLTEFEGVEQGLRNIYQYLQHLDSLFERHCKHIRDSIDDNFYELELYLKALFEWLPEQLKFDSVYDDSAVVDWLRQIYYKLGGGTYAPNPVADPGGFFGWLGGLVAGFLASLLAGLPGKIQELLSDLSDLTGYFPFSAPWDLYALLALFSHDPVTPVFTLPWGLGGGHTANVVVDCSQWDGVMSIVRSVEKIIFAGGLAKLTFDMFKPTDVAGD